MDSEVFRAGVRPGAPTTGDEIKILRCHILSAVGAVLSFAQLNELLTERELVNYFELVAALDSLSATGHIEVKAGAPERYAITELGRATAATIKTMLPPAMRERAERAAKKLLKREKREREVAADIEQLENGCEVRLKLPRGESVFAAQVFCATMEEAKLVRRRFLNDPA
jgi:hypothetical protein